MTKNGVLERLLLAIVDLLARTREGYLQNEERAHSSFRGHQEVLSAIKNRDGTAAQLAMRRHLESVEGILFRKKKGR
jgi:DNA-binding FadR family transcriptional regulator